jgi:hypothetical protein
VFVFVGATMIVVLVPLRNEGEATPAWLETEGFEDVQVHLSASPDSGAWLVTVDAEGGAGQSVNALLD